MYRSRLPRSLGILLAALAPLVASADEPTATNEPLAGWTGDVMFIRSADNQYQFFPNGRLQVDGYFFKRDDAGKMPTDTLLLRRARLEVFGWIGPKFGFNIAGDFALGPPAPADPVGQSWIAATDDYIMVAPLGGGPAENAAMIQVGQFDAPFTLENRTSDKYFDFMERPIAVRAFGIPDNKEVGAMFHGLLPNKAAYYSVAVINGDNQNFRNVDNNADVLGRAWFAPFALLHKAGFDEIEIGGSLWAGQRGGNGGILNTMTTQGGFAFTNSKGTFGPNKLPMELHQHGDLREWAIEANIPIQHRYGARVEFVHKNQELDIDDATNAAQGKLVRYGQAVLDGWSMYGELWWWVLGDDTIIGPPGLQLPPRFKKFITKPPVDGVMVATRIERLDMSITGIDSAIGPAATFGVGSVGLPMGPGGKTEITAYELGVNYWHSRRFRATFNYILNVLGGNSNAIQAAKAANGGSDDEHEFLFRMAVAL